MRQSIIIGLKVSCGIVQSRTSISDGAEESSTYKHASDSKALKDKHQHADTTKSRIKPENVSLNSKSKNDNSAIKNNIDLHTSQTDQKSALTAKLAPKDAWEEKNLLQLTENKTIDAVENCPNNIDIKITDVSDDNDADIIMMSLS